jgi:hypothetical protein
MRSEGLQGLSLTLSRPNYHNKPSDVTLAVLDALLAVKWQPANYQRLKSHRGYLPAIVAL